MKPPRLDLTVFNALKSAGMINSPSHLEYMVVAKIRETMVEWAKTAQLSEEQEWAKVSGFEGMEEKEGEEWREEWRTWE